jgi:hypothetical protein
MKNGLFSWSSISWSALFLLSAALAASAQTAAPDHPSTDTEKIADALGAGPSFITRDATLLDWPITPGGEYRVRAKESMSGHACREPRAIRTMNPDASIPPSCNG